MYYIITYLVKKSLNNIFNVLINKSIFIERKIYFKSKQKNERLAKKKKYLIKLKSQELSLNIVICMQATLTTNLYFCYLCYVK